MMPKVKNCHSFIKVLYAIPRSIIILIQVYNVLIGVLNIIGNVILIWGLRKTRQTKTISFQFIVFMSASDLITGIISPICMTLLSTEPYQNCCWMKLAVQAALATCNYFSAVMVLLIAFDRYLHMKYLERYSVKFTKRRGYFLVVISLVVIALPNAIFVAPLSLPAHGILKLAYFSFAILLPIAIIMLYCKAMQAMRRKANQITRSIINHNRALGNAAKRISICFLILTTPIIVSHILDGVNMQVGFIDQPVVNTCIWLAYITFLANGFCSSVIFISQNILIRRVLRRTMLNKLNCFRSKVEVTQAQT